MRRFAFRLARFERLRSARRRQARVALAAALTEARDRESRRLAAEAALEEGETAALPPEIAEIGSAWREMALWREGLRETLTSAARAELSALEQVRRSGHVYTEAARDHRVIERLRERRHARWVEEASREEQKFLDEVHILRIARQRRGRHEG